MMEAVRTSETSVDNHFTRQYNPEDNSEHYKTNYKGLIIYAELLNELYLTEPNKRQVLAVAALLYVSGCWTATKQQL
jgi:hypothetical protein